ncbi:LD-carboxypeptidase [Catellatospora sp. KI3]|uniref:S66 family peptidase n=1 Tax=Catellatospora sp. KI3 TaxID=3041620 RepID=UPI0024831912|nr:S66 peptidase family protein [Catellatospora sp. KI3]MDI1462421.1 LD-carboxypeptidase [Catellatospora sp. KI3]
MANPPHTPLVGTPKLRPGDRVAVLSPSHGSPAQFPHVYEQGLARLRDELGLVPVEFPTTRAAHARAEDRARDIEAAFADPSIRAVFATIGGDDQITVVPHLDPAVLRADPKPFFGYSDNTNLLNALFHAGVASCHGGSVMVHLARGGATHPATMDSLRAALFTDGWYELSPAAESGDEVLNWADPAALGRTAPLEPADGWHWHGPGTVVEGPCWGGNLEIISWLLQADRVGPTEAFAGHVLLIETSEEMPPAEEVFRMLRNMGERGLLGQFAAILVGRAKAWNFDRRNDAAAKAAYRDAQRAAVLRAVAAYNPGAVLVFDLDIGHTDPQLIVPIGKPVRVDAVARRVSVHY